MDDQACTYSVQRLIPDTVLALESILIMILLKHTKNDQA
jgi:hypothetical protein